MGLQLSREPITDMAAATEIMAMVAMAVMALGVMATMAMGAMADMVMGVMADMAMAAMGMEDILDMATVTAVTPLTGMDLVMDMAQESTRGAWVTVSRCT